jgi:ParB-like chromosome segregation protein Spo0J
MKREVKNSAAVKDAVWMDVSTLIPYDRNAKKHPESQIAALASMFLEFGFDQPIVVDKKMVIIKGHGRRLAAMKAGLKMVPVIVRDDLTPAQVRAARLADNRIAETDYDTDMMASDIAMLAEEDRELLDKLGMSDAELAKLLGGESDEAKEAEEQPKEWLVVLVCADEQQQSRLYEEMHGRGVKCKIM